MSGLKLRVYKYLNGDEIPRNGVVANVYAIDPGQGQHTKRNIVIPVGNGSTFEKIDLPPGNYLIEALMPSGDILSKEAVTEEGQWREIQLTADHSAHEWHSLPNLLGNVESQSAYYRSYNPVKVWPTMQVWVMKNPPLTLGATGPERRESWQTIARWIEQKPEDTFKDLQGLLEVSFPQPHEKDGASELHTFKVNSSASTQQLPRWYSLVRSLKDLKLVSVPAPWFRTELPEEEIPVDLLVRQTPDGDLETSLSVLDLNLATALGYMTRGSFKNAALLVDHLKAVDMLFDKFLNPLGAAAGGYLLLGTDSLKENRPWQSWITNLMNYFPWLPDGAIQFAWLQLRQGISPERRKAARDALITAFNRGLPYYSLGLQWLVDSLTLLGEEDEEAKQMLSAVQPVMWRADLSQTFTSIALGPRTSRK